MLPSEEKSLRAQIASNTRWAKAPEADRAKQGRTGQAGLRAKFAAQVDPNGEWAQDYLEQRVDQMMRAHMQRLVYARHQAAKAAKQAAKAVADLEAFGDSA